MPENHVNFVYKLDGDVKEIDVFKLAPALLALGNLIQESNREINPGGREIAVNVKPFRPGSFIVDLVIFSQNNLQQLLDLLGSPPAQQVKNLLEWIGLTVGGPSGIVGLVQLLKWLKGKPKAIEPLGPNQVRYTNVEGTSITIDQHVHQLFSNSSITSNVYNVFAAPMEQQQSITDVKTYIEGVENSEVRVDRSEVPVLKEAIHPSLMPSEAGETINEKIHQGVLLNPKRGAFGGDPKDWSFFRGDGIITATIRDKDFLAKCESGEYRLNQSDLLTVDLLERQKVKGTQLQKSTFEVIRYQKGESQATLPLE